MCTPDSASQTPARRIHKTDEVRNVHQILSISHTIQMLMSDQGHCKAGMIGANNTVKPTQTLAQCDKNLGSALNRMGTFVICVHFRDSQYLFSSSPPFSILACGLTDQPNLIVL